MEIKAGVIDLKSLSIDLINSEANSENIKKNIDQIHTHFRAITAISGYDSEVKNMITLPATKGMALSINHAAQCLLDYKRTFKFLKGFVKAIEEKKRQFPNEMIRVFYAGCGPYAPFVTLVAPLFSPEEIQFSLLEINQNSLEKAVLLIEKLKLTDYIDACYLSDATTFKVNHPEKYHLLFSETLDALLYRECYVPILWNLLPQFSKNITVIPENVKVDLFFKENSTETFETTIFDVSKALKRLKRNANLPEKFKPVRVNLSHVAKYNRIVLATEVQVYKDVVLKRNESSLTLTLEMEIEKSTRDKTVVFTYHTSPSIEFKFTLEQ